MYGIQLMRNSNFNSEGNLRELERLSEISNAVISDEARKVRLYSRFGPHKNRKVRRVLQVRPWSQHEFEHVILWCRNQKLGKHGAVLKRR